MKKNNQITSQLIKNKFALFIFNLWLIFSLLLLTKMPTNATEDDLEKLLPPLQIHPLPTTLEQWQDSNNLGNYFEQIKPILAGYLIWSKLPIKVYLDRPSNPNDPAAVTRRFNQWLKAVEQAIAEWNIYLSMIEVSEPEQADIIIERNDPPLDTNINPETGKLQIPRARTAQTRYKFYIKNQQLFHQMTIQISPRLGELSVLSAARHELGHALGIWGHSLEETDALYFSQVGNPPTISSRDINTLKKIYQQPTRLGWPLPSQF
ncbi:peptidase [Crocosphaera sp. UHCC 0190]|uniref:peptidase n=1 Tax=Crocosphaera sp. UHCC 0190 TaxID=3110246 RepID=UPI002B21719C|nr:peptidase [Crocosphaera sp. UHCC 0190]MEA5511200.1 peptidase [Crocosphaera sp. UHCC 0190]